MAVSEEKKKYMRKYNQRAYVKAKKAEYMRKKRAEKELEASRNLVNLFLEFGFENLAEEMAIERAPEMLATAKSRKLRRNE